MKGNFEKSLTEVLQHEGSYVNDPQDPGGRTNLGVTQAVYEAWVGHKVTEQIMRKLTPALVRPLYKKKYWDVVRADELPIGIDLHVFDFAVNAGPKRAVRLLQRAIGLPVEQQDGVAGPRTVAATVEYGKAHGLRNLIQKYDDAREAYYRQLPHFPRFGRGWLRRVAEVTAEALRMAKGAGHDV